MKYSIFLLILAIFITIHPLHAEVLTGGVELDWSAINQQERECIIKELQDQLFDNVNFKIDTEQFADKKKDNDYKINRYLLKKKYYTMPDKKIAGFYLFNKILFAYGIKYNSDLFHIYYYNAIGRLTFVDILDKPHTDYPHTAYQYDKKGKLIGIVYNISEYDQYVFTPQGEFKSRWYNEKCYDEKAKIIMTRRLPD